MTTHEPATPFWDGYRRSPEMTDKLVAAFRNALEANPESRACQILARRSYLFRDLWDEWDEDLLDLLEH